MTTESNSPCTGVMTYLDDNKEDLKEGHYLELVDLLVKAKRDMDELVSTTSFYKLTYINYDVVENCWSGEYNDRRFEIKTDRISRIFKAVDIKITNNVMINPDYDFSTLIGRSFALENDRVLFSMAYEKFNKHFYRLDPDNNYGVRDSVADDEEVGVCIEVPNPILIGIEKL